MCAIRMGKMPMPQSCDMSYTVLARRYRSSTFDEVVGQEHVAQTLKKAVESGRIAHAYLFCGTRGTGKTSMARILAKALNCQAFPGPTLTPCGKCDSCVAIARGDDIDVIEIDAASHTGVDSVREIIENSQYRPARGRFKVYIIDEAHMLSKNAFNALLKTLEEPPEHVKFILATTEAEKLLPTILSRCQRYDFRNISSKNIAVHLKEICKHEKIKADDDALALVARAGAGSMRDAISLLDRLLSIGEKHLTNSAVEQMLGLPPAQRIFDLVESIGSGDVKATLSQAEQIISSGQSVDVLVSSLSDHLRNLLIARVCGQDSALIDLPGIGESELAAQAGKFEPAALSQDITILEELRRNLRQSQTARALLDAILARLALSEQFTAISELLNRLDGTTPSAPSSSPPQKKKFDEIARLTPSVTVAIAPPVRPPAIQPSPPIEPAAIKSAPVQAQSVQSAPAEAPSAPTATIEGSSAPISDGDVPGLWPQVVAELTRQSASFGSILATAKLSHVDGNQAVISYHSNESFFKSYATNGKREIIARELTRLRGSPIGVRFEAGEISAETAPDSAPPPPRRASMDDALTPELLKQLQTDPLVKYVLEELGGEIKKVEPLE
jgi:DNA polymerase-3 subunit gamma/tau